jgi:hypothetical protein
MRGESLKLGVKALVYEGCGSKSLGEGTCRRLA